MPTTSGVDMMMLSLAIISLLLCVAMLAGCAGGAASSGLPAVDSSSALEGRIQTV